MGNQAFSHGSLKFCGQPRGIRVIAEDRYIPLDLVYPSGKKDGNKLGKKKRNLREYQILFDIYKSELYIHPTQIDKVTKAFLKNERSKFPAIKCTMFDSSTFWTPPEPFSLKSRENMGESEFKRQYTCNWDLPILKSISPMVMVAV